MAVTGAVSKLTKIQIGKETTKGTAVAATKRLLGQGYLRDISSKVMPERDYGLLDANVEQAELVALLAQYDLRTELSPQQLLNVLVAAVKGAVTGTEQTVGQGDYKYTFTPPASADPNPDTWTIQAAANDGVGNVQTLQSTYGIVTEFGISATQGEELSELVATLMARGATATAPTASIGIPSRTLIPSMKWAVYFATTLAGLASASKITGGAVAIDWALRTGLGVKSRLDGSLEALTEHAFGLGRLASLGLTLDLSATAETERASVFRGTTARAIRLEATGPQIGTGLNHKITIDGLYDLADAPDSPSDQEGQLVQRFNYVGRYEAAGAKQFEIVVITNVASIF